MANRSYLFVYDGPSDKKPTGVGEQNYEFSPIMKMLLAHDAKLVPSPLLLHDIPCSIQATSKIGIDRTFTILHTISELIKNGELNVKVKYDLFNHHIMKTENSIRKLSNKKYFIAEIFELLPMHMKNSESTTEYSNVAKQFLNDTIQFKQPMDKLLSGVKPNSIINNIHKTIGTNSSHLQFFVNKLMLNDINRMEDEVFDISWSKHLYYEH